MTRRAAIGVAVVGTVLVLAYAALAGTQILVLNPLAAAPGRTLPEVHADLAAANEVILAPVVVGILAPGPAIALGILSAVLVVRTIEPLVAGLAYAALLTFGAVAYFVASFGPGMALADAYGIGGADHSPWAQPLYATSLAALLAMVPIGALAIARAARSDRLLEPAITD